MSINTEMAATIERSHQPADRLANPVNHANRNERSARQQAGGIVSNNATSDEALAPRYELPDQPGPLPYPPALYYHPKSKHYYRVDARNSWVEVTTTSASQWLVTQGYNQVAPDKFSLSEVERALLAAQSEHNVGYVGPLAGYNAGAYEMNGYYVLVTDSPRFVEPVAGDWSMLRGILERMLEDPDHDQLTHYYGWLKRGLESYRQRKWMPGQALVLAGPRNCGKSLLIGLQTELFGGRAESPYQAFTGATSFNGDLFRAEHLVIDDECEARDMAGRRAIGSHLKQLAVNPTHRCHAKYQQAVTLNPRWRVTIAVNDEPERLQVLPPLDEDIVDKVMLFCVKPGPMPMPTETAEEQEAFRQALSRELPAFVHFLLNYEIPEDKRAPRFGIATFQHPRLLDLLNERKPEQQLLELVELVMGWRNGEYGELWRGTATELTALLHNHPNYGTQGRALVSNAVRCGSLLTRLMKGAPSRVTCTKLHNVCNYVILRTNEPRTTPPVVPLHTRTTPSSALPPPPIDVTRN
jgi:hypothetical protein